MYKEPYYFITFYQGLSIQLKKICEKYEQVGGGGGGGSTTQVYPNDD